MNAEVDAIKKKFPSGTRVVLIHMGDDPHPIPDGTRGTVLLVDDFGTVHTRFDNGWSLGMFYPEDMFCTETEWEERQKAKKK